MPRCVILKTKNAPMRAYLKDAIAFMGDIIYEAFAFVKTFCQKNYFLTEKAIDNKTPCVILYIIKKAKEFICVRKNRFLVLNEFPCFFAFLRKAVKRL